MTHLALAVVLLAGATADADFAARLHGQLSAKPGNLFYSPVSIRLALAMARAGARGETASQMDRVLGLPSDAPQYFKGLLADWHDLANPPVTQTSTNNPEMQRWYEEEYERRRLTLNVANKLWGARGRAFAPPFLATLQNAYGSDLEQLDFARQTDASRRTINAWVEQATHDKIKDLIASGDLSAETKMVITNAIYFKALWSRPFLTVHTRDEPFKTANGPRVQVPMMHQVEHHAIADTSSALVLELPYARGEMVMDIILPKTNLAAVEKQFAAGGLHAWVSKLQTKKVDITLPRFKTSYRFEVGETLQAMGMKDAFVYPKADFSGMDGSKELFISKVIHQAFVDVNEHGTEAAAATAVIGEAGGVPPPEKPVEFRADHPFLYVIRDTRSREVLFVGRVADPR